jgi:RNA 2',3'-cyclic 3'-phosphodiesterase
MMMADSSDQPTGGDVRTQAANRLFVAVWPSQDIVEVLSRSLPPLDHDARRVPQQNWHVTLRFLGHAPVDEVTARLERTILPAATASIGPAVTRLGPDAVVVPVRGLDHLAAAVRQATADLGRPPGPRPFNGHLTLARLRGSAASTVLGMPLAAVFDVREVALVTSTTLPTGAVYETLARFPTH